MKPKDEAAAAAAAKSLQSCLTLCNPIDGSPPGSPIPGILQARTLEWAAISFSNACKWKVKVKLLSRVWPFRTPWTAAYQAPLSMGFARQEHWSGLPLSSLKDEAMLGLFFYLNFSLCGLYPLTSLKSCSEYFVFLIIENIKFSLNPIFSSVSLKLWYFWNILLMWSFNFVVFFFFSQNPFAHCFPLIWFLSFELYVSKGIVFKLLFLHLVIPMD